MHFSTHSESGITCILDISQHTVKWDHMYFGRQDKMHIFSPLNTAGMAGVKLWEVHHHVAGLSDQLISVIHYTSTRHLIPTAVC